MFSPITPESVDGLPQRKRRRPALSCVQCRRRKIKCDRNVPCTPCAQAKHAPCTYTEVCPGSVNGNTAKGAASPAAISKAPVPQSYAQRVPIIPDNTSHANRNSTFSDSPTAALPFGGSYSGGSTLWSPSVGTVEGTHPRQNIEVLLDRVQKLEQRLSTTVSPSRQDPVSACKSPPEKLRLFGNVLRVPAAEVRGRVSKTRLFGQSHWMHSLIQFKKVSPARDKEWIDHEGSAQETPSEIHTLMGKCKAIVRASKAWRPVEWHENPNFKNYVPTREVSDKLVHLYWRTFESSYRILHLPSFQKEYAEYWNDPQAASTCFLVKLLLVMAIGSSFYQEADYHSVRSSAQQWVYAAQSWMSAPFEKARLDFSGLQVYCLVILACQTTAVGGDLVWISVGSLIRMAMMMGFHRDPKYFPWISVLQVESRRRLWATVLEMAVQTAFDSGSPPLISVGDWDTEPPSNIDDAEIDETTMEPPISKPSEIFTQTSIQIQLHKSIQIRLEIARLISDFRNEPSYEQILRLGTEITAAGREGMLLGQLLQPSASSHRPTALQRNLLDIPIRRVLLALHFPFAMKARSDPRFYFSRKVCLDTAITILTYSRTDEPPAPLPSWRQDDYTRFTLVTGGFFKEVLMYAAINILLEVIFQLEEESLLTQTPQSKLAREPLREYIKGVTDLAAQRIIWGENNTKAYVFLSALLAQVDAMELGEDPDKYIMKATKEAATHCLELLKKRSGSPPSPSAEGDVSGSPNGARKPTTSALDFSTEHGSMDQGFTWDMMMMPDADVNFDLPDTWLFEEWEENQEW